MGGPPASGLDKGLTTPYHKKKLACNEMLCKAFVLDRFFGMI
jgi:hypothetical protein